MESRPFFNIYIYIYVTGVDSYPAGFLSGVQDGQDLVTPSVPSEDVLLLLVYSS